MEVYMAKKFVTVVFALAGILCWLSGIASAQTQGDNLKDKRVDISLHKKPFWDLVVRLTDKYDIAIGFEQSTLDSENADFLFPVDKPELLNLPESDRQFLLQSYVEPDASHLITLEYTNERLETVLNDVVKQMKNYDWEINNDVVNIFPIRGRDPVFAKLMDQPVKKFSLGKGTQFLRIQYYTTELLPEFQDFLRDNGLRAGDYHFLGYSKKPTAEDMRFTNLTFREVLNAVVKVKRGGWILKRRTPTDFSPEKNFIELFI
jgi:hypothetical protein